jgi:hypothetical protein
VSGKDLGRRLDAARGDRSLFGQLFTQYASYLRYSAKRHLETAKLHARVDATEVDQEAPIRAQRAFPRSIGTTESRLPRWLLMVLKRQLQDVIRQHHVKCEDIRLDQSLRPASALARCRT